MKNLVATAPGKLVLCGEYAVLGGAPAISVAVDRRARVTLRDTRDDAGVIVRTVGYDDGMHPYRARGVALEAVGDRPALGLLKAAWEATRMGARAGLALELDTRPFLAGNEKLGLGSSAALTVALVKALMTWRGDDAGVEHLSHRVHGDLQHGRGSGVDIATSFAGGLILYRRERRRKHSDERDEETSVTGLGWPEGLKAAVLFSGVAASTPGKLERLESRPRHPVSDTLAEKAIAAARAWQEGDASEVLGATAGFAEGLADFSAAYDLDVFGGGHSALLELAAKQGLVYKPCGAGGGDVGVVLGDSAGCVANFTERAVDMGFKLLDLDLGGTDVEGLTVEWMHD